MAENAKNNQIATKKTAVLLAVIVVLALFATAGGVLAKYRSEQVKKAEMAAHEFHISSDYLEETAKTYTVSNSADGITIELYNYEKENTALVAETAITYQIAGATVASVTDEGGTVVAASQGAYTIPGGAKHTHKIRLTPGADCTVTVKTTAPYTKELKADFDLTVRADFTYDVERMTDNGDYYEMTLYTNQYEGKLAFQWPADLQPDNTDPVMRTWTGSTETYEYKVKPLTTYRLIFFNPANKEYTTNDFSVTKGGTT